MIEIAIPATGKLCLEHLVLDYNGTLARDGVLLDGVSRALQKISRRLQIHVITADTFGKVGQAFPDTDYRISVLPPKDQSRQKREYVKKLGGAKTVAIGNGRNDALMLQEAALGIVVIEDEGACAQTLMAADVVSPRITAALDLLVFPKRLVATLRS
jgi:soluble P-type ATPase